MIDIVQRLRATLTYDTPARYPEIVTEAANEIVQLRIRIETYKDVIRQYRRRDLETHPTPPPATTA